MTRRKIILISIPVIILLLGICGFLYIRSDSFLNNFIKPRLMKVLDDQIAEGYKVTLSKLSGNIFTGVAVENFRIEDNERLSILSTDEIVLKYNFFGLLKRKFLVTALKINAPVANLRRDSDGQINLMQVFRGSSQDSNASFAFAVSKAAINEGRIIFIDTQQNMEISLPDIDIVLEGKLEKWNHKGKLSIGKGSFTLNETVLPIERLKNTDFSVSTSSGNLGTLKLQLGNSFMEIQELKGSWAEQKWRTVVALTIDAADVQKFLSNDMQLAGLGKVVLKLNGTNSTFSGTFTGTSEAISITQIPGSATDKPEPATRQIDITDLSIDTTLNLAEVPQVTLNKFSAQIADGTLIGNGNAKLDSPSQGNLIERLQHFVKQPITYNSNWQISDVKLRSLLSMFLELPAETPHIESGTFSGSAQIKGDTTGTFHLDSSIKLSETKLLVGKGLKRTSLKDSSLNWKMSSSPENGSNISADGTIDSTSVSISGSYEDLDIQLENVDFGKLFKIFNSVPFKGIGSITAHIKKDGATTGYVEVPEAFFSHNEDEPILLGRLAGNFRYTDNVASFENVHLTKQGGTSVSIEGSINLTGKLPANFRIVTNPLVLDADYNKLLFTVDHPIEGNMKGELLLYGQLIDHLDGEGNFSIDAGKAWNINLEPTTLPLKIDDYALTIPNFVITASGQQVILNVNLENNGDFGFSLTNGKGKPVQLAELAFAAGITDFPIDGKMDFEVESYQKKPHDLAFTTKLNFSDITFEGKPLGDAYLNGILIEEKDHFEFTGKALAGTTDIEGIVSNVSPNPYKLTLKSKKTAVTPILRILHPALDAITGTIDSTVEVKGTIAELSSTELLEPSEKRVYPYDVDIIISTTHLQYNSLRFTNPKPIRLKLANDVMTISDSELTLSGEKSPFIQLIGTIDAKSEKINISAKSNKNFMLAPFGKAFGIPISGTANYELKTKGTLSDPIVDLKFMVPTLVMNADIGDISVRDANSEIKYQNNAVHIKPFSVQVLDNPLQIGGNITIHQNEFTNSKLNLEIKSDNLDLAKFSDLVRNSLPVETVNRLTIGKSDLIVGHVETLLNVAGTFAEPVIDLRTRTINSYPIRLGAFAKSITLDKLHALTTIRKQWVQIQDLVANGRIGKGVFQINGETSFSTQNDDKTTFDIGISVEKLAVADFITFYQQHASPIRGTVSGSMKLAGTGFTTDLVTSTCKINELNLQAHNYQFFTTSPIDFKLSNSSITSLLPLQVQIKSPDLETTVDISFDGPLTMPNLSAKWQGTFKHPLQKGPDLPLQWKGYVEYANKQLKLSTELSNNGDNLTLNGTIPFNLTLAQIDLSERFLEAPIEVRMRGEELPFSFFPGVDTVFSEVEEGVIDIDLTLQGTTRAPYLQGVVSLHAPKVRLNNFNQPFENVIVQLKARKGALEFAKFQFDIEDEKTCNLDQSRLELDGLTPKSFSVKDLSIKQYPLGSILRQALPQDTFKDVNGYVGATLTELNAPLESFFENGEAIPIPKIRQKITFDALTQQAIADFTIDNISLGFTALDQQFRFENPELIPITLGLGTFRVQGLKLENTVPIPSAATEDTLVFSCYGRWNMQGTISANLKLDNFNISILDPLLPNEYRDVYREKGVLSTNIDIAGSYAEPKVTIQLVGHELAINRANIDEFIAELHYSYEDQHWEISDNKPLLRLGKNKLFCSGKVPYLLSFANFQAKPLAEDMEVEFDLQLKELGFLSLMEPLIQSASGTGSINATISGTPKAPSFKGRGNFAQLQLASSPIYLEDTSAQFDFTESKLEIKTINGQLNKGSFSTKGEINLNWFKIEDINLDTLLTNCTFTEPRLYEITINSGDLRLHGKITDPILEGNIEIDSGNYRQDWNWEDVLNTFSDGTVSESDIFASAPILRELDLDVGIDIQNGFHLRSSTGGNTDIEIACSGQLTGAIQEPLFTGTVSILGEEISIFTQIFDIGENSTITNTSSTAFNPELNIFLELPNPIRGVLLRDGSTADLKITATITGILENGDIDKAKINLHAEPLNSSTTELITEADLLALLLPGNSFSRSFGGITFTISSGFDPNERHIIAEYPLRKNMSIKVEGDEKGEVGVDIQLLERRF